ncbi:putative tetraspanin/Peripherin [Helianthus annuus]|uniref:Putative tetraspanin11 n=1 Tax=Helianthus annuus TaxID=4232 RepID=A0A251TYZ8_HELAN|nr:tetraspanin-8 [Helianthus annuus]KAF5792600.1 putative tetraspanin/Peripherin [Helianthus annuus]KAJ0527531.1 putative tetraspanin/Peripherin [Helianthus annuus]KAJ0536262.1 putative tetraspanin/Peripherin [Helianthus annuus]KAJ0543938.1 putative tetraspanin/Peripherin [Helianthus annuus]KAJ0708994.1 putative tetraspanin/Peripherin [Helianthus annuus]
MIKHSFTISHLHIFFTILSSHQTLLPMASTSNVLTTILNVMTLLLGVILITGGVWTSVHPGTATLCEKTFAKPYLFTGIFLVLLAVLGIVGAFFRINSFLYIYSAVLLIIIVGLLAFAIFALVVTNKRIGKAVSNHRFREYRFRDYSKWLQKHVVTEKNWDNIKSCLIDSRICMAIARAKTAKEFYRSSLTQLESGCCKPPGNCKYLFVNATYWVPPKSGIQSDDPDCKSWSNNQKKLCYDCGSCKVGVLSNMKHLWRKFAMLNFSILVFVIVIYCISCCAIRNNNEIPQPCHI